MSEPSTTALLQPALARLAKGDESARAALIEHAAQRLQKLTRTIARDFPKLQRWQEADDLFQQAMLNLTKNLQTHTPQSPAEFFRWSARVIRNTLIDLARHHYGPEGSAAHHATPAPDQPAPDAADDTHNPSKLADWTDLHASIEALPDDERQVADLLWYHGLTQQEAAELLGVDRRTVIRRWQSARRKLAERLGELAS